MSKGTNNINGNEESSLLEDTSEVDKKDEKLIELLKLYESPKAPDFIRENILKSYSEEFQYRILWTKFKDGLIDLVSFNPGAFAARQLPVALASITIAMIITIILCYSYFIKNITPDSSVSNQQTPVIKVTSTPVPTITPSPGVTPSPSIAENNSKKGTTIKSNQEIINQKKAPKAETDKDLEDKVAVNKVKGTGVPIDRFRGANSTPNPTDQPPVTLSELVYVGVSPLKIKDREIEPIDLEIEKELTEAIRSNKKWKLPSESNKAQAVFVKQQKDGALVLVSSNRKTLWKDENYIEKYQSDKNYIKSVIDLLTESK